MSPNTGNLGLDLRGALPRASVIALTDRPGNRKPIRELIENLYLKVEDGEIVCRPVGPGGPGSGLTPSFLVPPPDSLLGSIGTDETKYAQEGHSHLLNISPTALPLPNGVASIGNGYTYADIYHTHPIEPVTVTGSYLYPALVIDPKVRQSCKGMVPNGSGVGFGMSWGPIGGGMWQHSAAGQLPIQTAGTDVTEFKAQDGDRLFAYSPAYSDSERQYYGIYEVLDCGFHMVPTPGHPETLMGVSTQAVIRRALDCNTPETLCHGMVVQIEGPVGVQHNGDYFTLSTADPIAVDTTDLTFSIITSYTAARDYPLLTQAQLTTTDNLSPTTQIETASATNTTAYLQSFETTVGIPGVTLFPAGTVTFTFEGAWVDVNLDGLTFLGCELWVDSGTTLSSLGQPTLQWRALAAAPNGDMYAAVNGGDLYKQTGGVGNFVALGQTPRNWTGLAVSATGVLYGAVAGGDIYKTESTTALNQSMFQWSALAAAPNGDMYAAVNGGDVYKQTAGVGNFVALGQTPRPWTGLAVSATGVLYGAVAGGDIYYMVAGTLVALSQPSLQWSALAAAPNGDMYAAVDGGDVYLQAGGSGSFVAQGQTSRSWTGLAVSATGVLYSGVAGGTVYHGGGSLICTGESQPLNAIEKQVVFQSIVGTPIAIPVTARLIAKPYIRTTSTFNVTLSVRYGTPYITKIEVPFSISSGTTIDHRKLTFRDAPNQHPATSVSTDVTNFNHNLSAADSTVQKALDTLDNLIIPPPATVPTASTAIPLADALVGSAGSNPYKFTQEGHIHPLNPAPPPPSLASSTLYTAKVGGTLFKGDVYCPFKGSELLYPCYIPDPTVALVQADFVYQGGSGCLSYFFPGWNELSPGVWQDSGDAYHSYGIFASQCDGHAPVDGEFFIAYTFDPAPGEIPKQQIYQVVDCGYHIVGGSTIETKVTVQRATDYQTGAAYVANLHLYVRNGLLYAGKWFHLLTSQPITLDTTDMYWEVLSSYTQIPAKEEILSSAQMVAEGASNRLTIAQQVANSSAEPGGIQMGPTFTSQPLGVTSIPAGQFTAWLLLRNNIAATSFVEVRWWIKHSGGSTDAPFLSMTSAAIIETYDDIYEIHGTLATPVTTVSTDVVQMAVFTHSPVDIRAGLQVTWTFQEPSRFSRFRGTWQPDGVIALFAGWTEISPGIMQRNTTGPLSLVQLDGVPVNEDNPTGVSRMIGQTVFAYDVFIDDASKKLTGPWIIDDVGGHIENYGTPDQIFVQTHARMHRVPDYSYSAAFVHGMMFQCDNGDTYGGGYFTLNSSSVVLGTTAMDWSWTAGAAPTTDDKYEALTGPQLTSEGALTTVLEQSVTTASSGGGAFAEAPFPHAFVTLAGTPGVASLAAGPYTFDVEAVRVFGSPDLGSLTFLRVRIQDVDNGSAEILVADSDPPPAGGGYAPLHFVKELATAYGFAPDRRFLVQYYLRTNSTGPVTMTMRYNSATRGTKLTVPFVIPVSGASDGVHDHLSGRNTVNNHYGVGTCTTVSGVIPTPTQKNMVVTVSGTTTLTEMGTTGLEDGVDVDLVFLQACKILNHATPATGNACFIFDTMVDGTPNDIDWTLPTPRSNGRFGVKFYKTALPQSPCFLLMKGPII